MFFLTWKLNIKCFFILFNLTLIVCIKNSDICRVKNLKKLKVDNKAGQLYSFGNISIHSINKYVPI